LFQVGSPGLCFLVAKNPREKIVLRGDEQAATVGQAVRSGSVIERERERERDREIEPIVLSALTDAYGMGLAGEKRVVSRDHTVIY